MNPNYPHAPEHPLRTVNRGISRVPLLLCALLILLTPSPATAAGLYIPQAAHPALPTIPFERALIVHRNDTETLVIESAFQSDSPDVAWLLPLPARPTRLELADPGTLTSASMSLHPNLYHDPLDQCLLLAAALEFNLILLAIMFSFHPTLRRQRIRILVYGTGAILTFFVLLTNVIPTRRHVPPPPTTVIIPTAQRLGPCQFTVLTDPHALDAWLTRESFRPLDPTARLIITDNLAHGGCLLAAKIHHDSSAPAVPPPLLVTFPAKTPVLPMKLTALANSPTHLEIITIADQQTSAPGFHCAAAGSFQRTPETPTPHENDEDEVSPHYYSRDIPVTLGSPDVSALMWNHCIVTKLTADLPPSATPADIALSLQPLTPHCDQAYMPAARHQIAAAWFGIALAPIATLAILVRRKRPLTPARRGILLALALAACLIPTMVYLLLPTVPLHTYSGNPFLSEVFFRRCDYKSVFPRAADEGVLDPNTLPPSQYATLPQLLVDKQCLPAALLTNPYTGQPIRHERSPGNFTIRPIQGHLHFCLYDADGTEEHIPLTPPPLPQPTTP